MISPHVVVLLLAGLLPVHAAALPLSQEPSPSKSSPTRAYISAWVSPNAKVPIPIIPDQHGSLIRLALTNDPLLQHFIPYPIRTCHALGNAVVAPTHTRIFIHVHTLLCITDHGSMARKFEGEFITVADGAPGVPIQPLPSQVDHSERYYLLTEAQTRGVLLVESVPPHP